MTPTTTTRRGFTLIEILVVIAIIALLVALVFPTFSKAKEAAKQAPCMGNLHQIGMAMAMYKSDFGELAPHLSSLYPTYTSNAMLFICPADTSSGQHEGDEYMEGNLHLPSGVSYTYIPNWKHAYRLGWWHPKPRYGDGKWDTSTPLAMCHWHWAAGRKWHKELDTPSWGGSAKGWMLVLAADASVHKVRAETSADAFSPDCY